MAQAPSQQALLLFRVGPIFCCAGTNPVTAIIEPRPLTHPPGSTAAAPGICKHAGKIVRCRDLRYLFGVTPATTMAPQRLVITDLPGGPIGFYVDEIIEVMAMPAIGFGPLPALIPRGVFSRTLVLEQHIYLAAEFAALATLQGSGYLRRYLAQLQVQAPAAATPAVSLRPHAPPDSMAIADQPQANSDRDNTPAAIALRPMSSPAHAIPAVIHKITPRATYTNSTLRTANRPRPIPPRRPLATFAPVPPTAPPPHSIPVASYVMPRRHDASHLVSITSASANPTASLSLLPVIMLLVLFVGGLVGMVWWLLAPSATTPQPTTTTLSLTVALPSTVQAIVPLPVMPPTTVPPANPLPATVADATTPPSHYQASIARDNEGITIELEAPPEDPVFSPAPSAAAASPAMAASRPTPSSPVTPTPPQTEIIHIVVTGDTLWHIAKRYVNDPYRYPELARLSQITNPDLIYPGNRVRIIKKHRK